MDEPQAGIQRPAVLGDFVAYHQRLSGFCPESLAGIEKNFPARFQPAHRRRFPDGVEVGFRKPYRRQLLGDETIVREDGNLQPPCTKTGEELLQLRTRAELVPDNPHLSRHISSIKPLPAAFRPLRRAFAHSRKKRVVVVLGSVEMPVAQLFPALPLRAEHPEMQRIRHNKPKRKMTGLVKSPVQIKYDSFRHSASGP